MTRHLPLFVLASLLPLAACGDKDDGGGAEADADTDTDTDSDTDSDTDTDTDTDTDSDADGDFTVAIEGDTDSSSYLTISKVTRQGDGLLLGTTVSADLVTSASMEQFFPEVTDTDLEEQGESGVLVSSYVLALHQEEDGEGLPDPGELIRGLSPVWLIYVESPDDFWLEAGYTEGWHAVASGFGEPSVEPEFYELDAVPLPTNLDPVDSLSVSGVWESEIAVEEARIAMVPVPALAGDTVETLLYDEVAASSFTIAAEGAAPDDHISEGGGPLGAVEALLAFSDADGSGGFSADDPVLRPVCSLARPVVLIYSPEVIELQVGLFTVLAGQTVGWSANAESDDGGEDPSGLIPLTEEEMTSLSVSDGCTLGGGGEEVAAAR